MPVATFITLLTVLAVLLAFGLYEYWKHKRNLARIPFRVHVNGTRGKSSVVRLIAAGLRAGGKVVTAKTTGTLARVILPDATEFPVYRPGRANVIEQVRVVDTAVSMGTEILVIECMALQPLLQWISESKLVQATHGVITNARPDHLDVMGPDDDNVARALAGMTPQQGKMYTCETQRLRFLQEAADDRGTEMIHVGAEAAGAITEADLGGFAYVEHPDNVALALAVCADLGVDKQTALGGMWAATPDPGALTYHELEFFGRRIIFANAFAANDPQSTGQLWDMARAAYPDVEKSIALFNCRSDRQDRSRQLGEAVATWEGVDECLLMGTGTFIFARAAARAGMSALKFNFAEDRPVDDIFEAIVGSTRRTALVIGMGNVAGYGLDLVQYFRNRERVA